MVHHKGRVVARRIYVPVHAPRCQHDPALQLTTGDLGTPARHERVNSVVDRLVRTRRSSRASSCDALPAMSVPPPPFSQRSCARRLLPRLPLLLLTFLPLAAAFRFPGEPTGTSARDAPKSRAPVRIALSGGVLHVSSFYFNASVGGQHFTLLADISYSSLILPRTGCSGCRVGNRRYHPKNSTTSSKIPCNDPVCRAPQLHRCAAPQCFNCIPNKGAPADHESTDGTTSAATCCVEGASDCAVNVQYGDGSSGNGTMFRDRLELRNDGGGGNEDVAVALQADVLLGAMHAESHDFELPYADGVFGMAFKKGACRPACVPPLMDQIVEQTGISDVFTMCVTPFGGALTLGAADAKLARGEFRYVEIAEVSRDSRFVTPASTTWKVNERTIELPDITTAMWTTSTHFIGISKTSFLALLQHLTQYYCDVPGLCSTQSWFRPQKCVGLPDTAANAMPNLTIPLAANVALSLTPDDYLPRGSPIRGHPVRCVAFAVTDQLVAKGIGLLVGTVVLQRQAVVFDRARKRLGVAPAGVSGVCGPTSGDLPVVAGSANTPILTAEAPRASPIPAGETGGSAEERDAIEELCRAQKRCAPCAKQPNCSFGYREGRCVPHFDAGPEPYPFCSGVFCACFAVGRSGWYVGIALGVMVSLGFVGLVVVLWRKVQQRNFYRMVDTYEEQDIETF